MWSTQSGEVDVFLKFSCIFSNPTDVGNLISGSSAFSKASMNIWKFMVHILLKPGLENFEHYFASVWDECNCVLVWTFFGIAFLKLDLIISERNYHGLVEQNLGIQSSELSYIALTCSVGSDSLWPNGLKPTSSFVHRILQESMLECVVISFSRGSPWPKDQTWVSWIGRQILYPLTHCKFTVFPT